MRHLTLVLVGLLVAACGGGSGGGADPGGGGNGGDRSTGFVDIREPIFGSGSYTTIQPSLEISGTAFTSPDNIDCVSIFPVQLTMTWRNDSTGQTGSGWIDSFCQSTFLGLQWGTRWTIIYGDINLQPGRNEIRITASDNAGKSGTATIIVTRNEDVTAPRIVGRTPAPDAVDVPVNQNLAVQFSEAMLASSLTGDRFVLEDSTGLRVDGITSYDSTNDRWQLNPIEDLLHLTTYRVTIDGQVEDRFGGNTMGSDVSWTFTTAPSSDVTPPQVSEVSPAPGTTCTAPDTRVIARFDEALDSSTIDGASFRLEEAGGAAVEATVSYDGATATLEPLLSLLAGTDYEAVLAATISDLAGNPLGADFRWAFRTAAAISAGLWSQTTTVNAPVERRDHTATWTGSEMIVLGGRIGAFAETDSGGRYDPVTDTWLATSTDNVTPFSDHTAVWADGEIIVWGGNTNAGARYDLSTDSWQPTNTTGAPAARSGHAAVWTGTEMIVWGGETTGGETLSSGGRYDPSTDTWRSISSVGAPSPRRNMAYAWTGTEFFVWGGIEALSGGAILTDGARYDPATDTWTPLPAVDGVGGSNVAAAWTGSEVLVWDGGQPAPVDDFLPRESTLRAYDPVTNAWRASTSGCEPFLGVGSLQLHWTGSRLIVWVGESRDLFFYDPLTDSWQAVDMLGGPGARDGDASVWAGDRFIVWGGQEPAGLQDTGFMFRE